MYFTHVISAICSIYNLLLRCIYELGDSASDVYGETNLITGRVGFRLVLAPNLD